jgi:predicted aspartyl protease
MKRAALLLATFAVIACGPPPKPTGSSQTTSTGSVVVSGPPLATVAPDAQAVLDDWATAMGGRDAIAALGELHAKGTYSKGGMMGTIELWITPRGERREEITLGPLREIRVFDGTHGWLVDRNREVRELAGFELDDQRALAFRETWAPLLLDRRAGTVSRDGEALVLSPEGGNRPETVTFDRGTKLPATFVRRDSEKMRTTRYSDWNVVEGVKLPFTIREETGNPNDRVTIHWTRLERAHANASRFTRPGDREPDWSLATDPVVVPIEVAYGGLIFVKVSINDQPMSFVFDTGAEFTLLNSSRVSKLGLQGIGTFATGAGGGDVVVSFVPGVTTMVGGATVSSQIVGAVLLDALEKPLGRPLDGILGYDFISRFVVELDYKRQQMRLFDRTKYVHVGSAKPTPITLEDSTPYFDAAIEVPNTGDVGGNFVLDTGCLCEVQLFSPFVDRHGLLSAFPHAKQAGYSAGAGGTTNQLSAKIPALKVAGYMIKDPQADFSRDKHGATADPETAGLIGSLVFKKFLLVLDYKNKQVFFEPLKN